MVAVASFGTRKVSRIFSASPLLAPEKIDRLPVLLPVLGDIDGDGKTLFIGNAVAANDADLLLRNGVTSTMNLAVNIEMPPLALGDGSVVRRTHIGLIDPCGAHRRRHPARKIDAQPVTLERPFSPRLPESLDRSCRMGRQGTRRA